MSDIWQKIGVNVVHPDEGYQIVLGKGAVSYLCELIAECSPTKVIIVADSGVPKNIIDSISNATKSKLITTAPPGENAKSIEGAIKLWEYFKEQALDKNSLVVNVGGGVISDLGGFAASTYMRGVPFVHVPTTLLAQVDASIGGKVGINFHGIKNLIGSILQPKAVIIDTSTLVNLPKRQLLSGFGEIVKHGIIRDLDFFKKVSSKSYSDWNEKELLEIIVRSCEIKKDVISEDPYDIGLRRTLNFGHTVGHALESYAISKGLDLLHGEAVALGMRAECFLSMRSNRIPEKDFDLINAGLLKMGFTTPSWLPLSWEALFPLMLSDKKNTAGKIKWCLIKNIGEAEINCDLENDFVKNSLKELSYVA